MKFRTELEIPTSEIKINPEDKIFSIGSCFAAEISQLLQRGQLQTYCNPFGTLFNPYSIEKAIDRVCKAYSYSENDLICHHKTYISLDHYSGFDSDFAHITLEKINTHIEKANQHLRESRWIIITFGTAFVYEFLPQKKIVANCHKIPQQHFSKRLLTDEELRNILSQSIKKLQDFCPEGVQILLTVSPVRHLKDGIPENTLSKSKLISAIYDILPHFQDVGYLPVYELVMDDLRDYRFYKEDLLHPNEQAVQYIFEKFGNAFFSNETKEFLNENFKIHRALQHKSFNEKSLEHQNFKEKLKKKIEVQQTKVKHKIFLSK